MIAANVVALVFTVVFARVLGATDYGSLAALMSAFIILMVPGSALQIAVAREVSPRSPPATATRARACGAGSTRLLVARSAVAVVAMLLRDAARGGS